MAAATTVRRSEVRAQLFRSTEIPARLNADGWAFGLARDRARQFAQPRSGQITKVAFA